MKRTNSWRNAGITLAEVLIATGIIAAMVLMAFSVLGMVEERGRGAGCVLNLRQIAAAALSYQAENRSQWTPNRASPGSIAFSDSLKPYLGPYQRALDATAPYQLQRGVLICPGDRFGTGVEGGFENVYTVGSPKYPISYAQNGYLNSDHGTYGAGVPLSVVMPSRLATYMDWEGHYIATLQTLETGGGVRKDALMKRHRGKINVAFADGHVETWRIDALPDPVPPPHPFWTGRSTGPMP